MNITIYHLFTKVVTTLRSILHGLSNIIITADSCRQSEVLRGAGQTVNGDPPTNVPHY